MAVIPAEQLPSEADGENINLHAIEARDDEMAEFVNENDNGQDDEKGKDRRPKYGKDVHAVRSLQNKR